MISTPRDNNGVPTLLATLNTDGVTPISVCGVEADHTLCVSDGSTGSSFTSTNAQRDDNRVPALWATSSADGITPIPVYCDSNGKLLIDNL